MADTPRGAPAPISSAALAASPNTSNTTPAPHELLQQLAGWMSASGYADDHPWQAAIGATLAAHAPQLGGHAATLFRELSSEVDGLSRMLLCILNGDHELIGPAFTVTGHLGWLCDVASVAYGDEAYRGDAEAWFLSPAAGGALAGVRAAAGNEGGAA